MKINSKKTFLFADKKRMMCVYAVMLISFMAVLLSHTVYGSIWNILPSLITFAALTAAEEILFWQKCRNKAVYIILTAVKYAASAAVMLITNTGNLLFWFTHFFLDAWMVVQAAGTVLLVLTFVLGTACEILTVRKEVVAYENKTSDN